MGAMERELAAVKTLFDEALEIAAPAERMAFLDRACADAQDLRLKVEALLRAYEDAGGFMQGPHPIFAGKKDESLTEHAGTVIGPYKLLEQIGEGGFGVVFLAEQREPVRRKVALKVIKPGMDSKQVIARFEAERQALALMHHSNIARVLDAGATDSGRPYFVMELVKGIPITQFCDENRLTPRERLELFVSVCQAVQHAHQKGIIHRDLKPSNVLVTQQDGTPVVKVIDFGIAKALGPERLTDKTLFTGFAHMIGSPLYMSPEQAEISEQDADTRTDIYSLGVLLYELLTGTTPFDKERLKRASYDEIRRILREEEPAKPSTRISTLGQAAPTVSANRKSEPRRLSQLFRGELDWIVMKALEKDRNRRYETASSFAADVQRYLHDEPVQACPPSAAYRFRKFALRNKAVLTTICVVGLAVCLAVLGLASSTVLAWQANQRVGKALEHERQTLYFQRIALADREWSANNFRGAEQQLDACPEDLRGWEWRYLKRRRLRSVPPLGHPSAALTAVFSPDGQWIISGSQDGKVRIWNWRTGQMHYEFEAHERHVRSIALSADGRCLATGSWDGTAAVWSWETTCGEGAPRLLHHRIKGRINHVALNPDATRLALAGDENCIVRLWDVVRGEELPMLQGHTGRVQSVVFSPDGQYLASASSDATVRIWDMRTAEVRHVLSGHSNAVMSVRFSADGQVLASCSANTLTKADGEIKVWQVSNGDEIQTLRGHTGPIMDVAFSPDGSRLASTGMDEGVALWDLATGQQVFVLRGHRGLVRAVNFGPDGNQLVSAGGDGRVLIWDATPLESQTEDEAITLEADCGGFTNARFSPDGRWLVSGGNESRARLWELPIRSGAAASARLLPSEYGGRVDFSPDGRFLVLSRWSGMTNGCLTMLDTTTWKELYADATRTWPVSFRSGGREFAAGSAGFTIEVCDVRTGQRTRPTLKGHGWAIFGLAFRPSGNYAQLASASADGEVRLWDVTTGDHQRLLKQTEAQFAVAFSHDGRFLASGGLDRVVRIWDTTTWRQLRELTDATGGIQSLAFHPTNPRALAWGGTDGTVKIVSTWDTARPEIRTLRGHTSWVEGVSFSPDGAWIASTSLDRTMKLWRTDP
jgi:WD40 repeat protein/serine/threonine protein kinase